MDHSVVQLLTHPDLYSGIDSDRLLRPESASKWETRAVR